MLLSLYVQIYMSLDITLDDSNLRIEDGRPSSAEDSVVRKGSKPKVEEATLGTLPHASNADGVSARDVSVESGLRSVGLVEDADSLAGRRRSTQLLSLRLVFTHGLHDLLGAGTGAVLEAQRNESHVTIRDSDTGARSADAEASLLLEGSGVRAQSTQNLLGLVFKLVLLSANEGNHVVHDVHARNAGIASSRQCLLGEDLDFLDGAELGLEGGEGNDDANDSTVGVADEESLLQAKLLSLVRDQIQMVGVHGGDDEGHQGMLPVVLCVREDGDFGLDELHLCKKVYVNIEIKSVL